MKFRIIIAGLVLLALWGLAGLALGASPAQVPVPGGGVDFVSDLWAKVQQAGPFAAMLCLWFLYRSERRSDRLQMERDGLLERVLTGLNNTANVIDRQSAVIERLLNNPIVPDPGRWGVQAPPRPRGED